MDLEKTLEVENQLLSGLGVEIKLAESGPVGERGAEGPPGHKPQLVIPPTNAPQDIPKVKDWAMKIRELRKKKAEIMKIYKKNMTLPSNLTVREAEELGLIELYEQKIKGETNNVQ